MIKTMFAFGALAVFAAAAPAAAQMAAGSLPKCSATVHDSCDQGANNPRAMSAAQAEASGGVGDRKSDAMAAPKMMHKKHKAMHKVTTTTDTTTDTKPM